MTELLEAIRGAKERGDFGRLVESIPYARFLGITVEHRDGVLLGRLAYSDPLIGNPVLPALHGGAIGGLLESTALFQALWEAETAALPKIITLTIDYLRSGRPTDTFARAIITKPGRRVINVSVSAWQDDPARPIASANAHFLIQPAGG